MKTPNYKVLLNEENYNHAFATRLRGTRNLDDGDRRYLNEAAISLAPLTLPSPIAMQAKFEKVRNAHSVMRRLCRTVDVTQGGNAVLTSVRTSGAEWLEPGGTYPIITESVARYQSSPHKLGVNVVMSEDLVQDTTFDVVGLLADAVGRRFALAEDTGIVNGTGADGQLTGLTQQATVQTVDSWSYDALRSVYFSVPSEYRANGTWVMSDTAAESIRGLVDDAGRPLLNIANGMTLFGRPVEVCAGCEDGQLVFGDFSTVWLLDRSRLFVQPLSELYTVTQETGYHCWALTDSVLTRPEAVVCATIGTETTDTEDEDAE